MLGLCGACISTLNYEEWIAMCLFFKYSFLEMS